MESSFEIPQEQSRELTPVQALDILLDEPRPSDTNYIETVATTDPFRTSTLPEQSTSKPKAKKQVKLAADEIRVDLIHETNELSVESAGSDDDEVGPGYRNILLRDMESSRLIHRFRDESYKLAGSSAKGTRFELQDCYHRLAGGHDVQLLNYLSLKFEDYRVYATPEGLEWKQRSTSRSFVKYSDMSGIMLGSHSATFRRFQQHGFSLKHYNVAEVDCMTIITDIRSFDVVADDDTIKYDLYIMVAWQISTHSVKSSMIPLSKTQLSVVKIKMKLEAMARARYLFVDELLLLGILKALYLQSRDPANDERIARVKAILDSKFNLTQKMYRIARRMKPENFFISKPFNEKFANRQRIQELQQKMVAKLDSPDRQRRKLVQDWQTIRRTLVGLPAAIRLSMGTRLKSQEQLTEEELYRRAMTVCLKSKFS